MVLVVAVEEEGSAILRTRRQWSLPRTVFLTTQSHMSFNSEWKKLSNISATIVKKLIYTTFTDYFLLCYSRELII